MRISVTGGAPGGMIQGMTSSATSGNSRSVYAPGPQVGIEELVHALDNSTPYPVELDRDLLRFMAGELLKMLEITKRPHSVWVEETEPMPEPMEPMDPSTLHVARCPEALGTFGQRSLK